MSMVGETVKQDRRAVSMASRGLISLPVVLIAPPLGGLLIATLGIVKGVRAGLLVTIVLTFIAVAIQHRFYRLPQPAAKKISLNPLGAFERRPKAAPLLRMWMILKKDVT